MKAIKSTKVLPRPVQAAPLPAAEIPWWYYGLGVLGALLVVLFIYGPALNGPFLLDDTYLPYLQPEYATKTFLEWVQGVRPLLMATYYYSFHSSGDQTFGYHFLNLVLHLLNGGLIFAIVRKVLEWAGLNRPDRLLWAAFGSLLFLVHPLSTESVSYIVGRSETLSVFFFLAAFAVFVYRREAAISWANSAFVLLLFVAACLSKEHAAVLPGLLLLTDYFWNPGFSLSGIQRNWKVYVPIGLGAIVAVGFVFRLLSTSTSAGFALKDLTWYQYFFTQCRAIWRYVLFYVLPLGQNIDHDFSVSKSLLDPAAAVGLAALIAAIAAAWIYRRKYPLISYGLFAMLLLFAPTSSIVPIQDTLVERRMYLPFIGFVFVAIGLLRLWKTSRMAMATALGVILLASAGLTYARNQLWGSAISMWSDSVSKAPQKVRPRFQLAYAYYSAQQCADAAREFASTAKLKPPTWDLLVDWGLAADCAGNSGEALARLREAVAQHPTAHIYSQVGMVYAKAGQYPQALDALDRALQMDPNWEMSYVYRGNVYALQGRRPEAIADYQKALEIDPANQSARQGLIRLAPQR